MAKKNSPTTDAPTDDTVRDAPGDPALDVMPDPDDDAPAAAKTAKTPADPDAEEVDDEPAPPKIKQDTARDEIAARYRALRDAPPEEEAGEGDEDEPDAAAAAAAKPTTPAPAAKPAEANDDLKLMVDGKEVTVSRSKYALPGASDDTIKAIAQREIAADNRLREANRLIDEAKSISGRKPEDQPDASKTAARTDDPPDDKTKVDQEKLAQIVERIQVGNAEEGKAALVELIDLVGTAPRPEDIERQVSTTLERHDHEKEIREAVQAFGKSNPDLISDPDLAQVAISVLGREMLADMKNLGIPDAELAALKEPMAISAAHARLRRAGHQVRRFDGDDGLLAVTANGIRAKFNIPKPDSEAQQQKPSGKLDPATAQERTDRKRAAKQQPRTAGLRNQPAQPPKPRTAGDYVQEMRRQRGYTVTQ